MNQTGATPPAQPKYISTTLGMIIISAVAAVIIFVTWYIIK